MSHCHYETLARSELAHVQRCSECGGLTVHLGPVSVRLDERTLRSLLGVLGEAAAQLETPQAWPSTEGRPGLA
ncbi:MAG: hypothetical protein ACOZQL_14950 [Myxococcota bacterium]